jgi:hypothetical protein
MTECCGNRASGMGFNRRKLEDQRRQAANKEAAKRRATRPSVSRIAGGFAVCG